jgi:hypothetical protein
LVICGPIRYHVIDRPNEDDLDVLGQLGQRGAFLSDVRKPIVGPFYSAADLVTEHTLRYVAVDAGLPPPWPCEWSGVVLIAAVPRRGLRMGSGGALCPSQIRSLPAEVFLSDHIERYRRPFCQSAAKFVASSEAFASNDRFVPAPIRLPRQTATVRTDSKSTAA